MVSSEAERQSTAVLFANADRTKSPLHDDDDTTARTLSSYRVIVAEQIRRHTGRAIRAEGDTILAEFSGPVPAVECAVEIQRELTGRNRELPATSQVRGRVGVSLGDAEEPDGDRFEDGVESAAILATLAEPGGICISRAVYDEVRFRLNLSYDARKTLASFMNPQQHVHHAPEVSLLKASAVRISPASIVDQGGAPTDYGHQKYAGLIIPGLVVGMFSGIHLITILVDKAGLPLPNSIAAGVPILLWIIAVSAFAWMIFNSRKDEGG